MERVGDDRGWDAAPLDQACRRDEHHESCRHNEQAQLPADFAYVRLVQSDGDVDVWCRG